MRNGLFLDLDGTVVVPASGEKFAKDANDWKFVEGIIDRIKWCYDNGYLIFIVSNQSGIDAGYVREAEVNARIEKIKEAIVEETGARPFFRFCSSNDTGHYQRKPNPGMAHYIAQRFNVCIPRSFMVGNGEGDAVFAANAGMGFIRTNAFLELSDSDIKELLNKSKTQYEVQRDTYLDFYFKQKVK